jgi:hypothetical protein
MTHINVVLRNYFRLFTVYPKPSHKGIVVSPHILWLALFLVACSSLAVATTVVVVLDSGDRIIMGADGRVLSEHPDGTRIPGDICKIQIVNRVALSYIGIRRYEPTGFDVNILAQQAFAGEGTIRYRMDRLHSKLFPELNDAFLYLKTVNRPRYDEKLGKTRLEIVASGLENGKLTIVVNGYFLSPTGEIIYTPSDFVDEGSPGALLPLILGFKDLATKETGTMKNRPRPSRNDLPGVVKHLIELEFFEDESVGPPISMLEITQGGDIHWIEHGNCKP